VIFDLDGVLADSSVPMSRAIAQALGSVGAPRASPDELRALFGPPLEDGFATLLTRLGADPKLNTRCVRVYREHYVEYVLEASVLYDGIGAALAGLAGSELVIATSKAQPFATPLVRHLGIEAAFTAVVGTALENPREPKAHTIGRALALAHSRDAVMVGDTAYDVAGAHANGLACVGALWGFGTLAELTAAGTDVLAGSPADLSDAVVRAYSSGSAR